MASREVGLPQGLPPSPPRTALQLRKRWGLWLIPDSYDITFLHIFPLIVQVSNIWDLFLYKDNEKRRQKTFKELSTSLWQETDLSSEQSIPGLLCNYLLLYFVCIVCVHLYTSMYYRVAVRIELDIIHEIAQYPIPKLSINVSYNYNPWIISRALSTILGTLSVLKYSG